MSEAKPPPAPPASDDDYDPFEAFNAMQGMGSVRDPYSQFAEMRSQCPVHKQDLRQILNLPEGVELPIKGDVYTVMTHNGVSHVLRDGKTFSSSGYAQLMGIVMGHSILEMDEPEHSRYRGLIQQAFSKRALERWERDLVGPIVHGLIDRFADRGRADLVRELTFPFPVHVIAGMLGLPAEDLPRFHRWTVELISVAFAPERGMKASQNLYEYFIPILDARRRDPRDDLISVLTQAELEGQRLSNDEIAAFLRLLLPAGAETTYRSSSNLLYGLLTQADQLEALLRDRALMDAAIEEGVRWEPPLTGIQRTTTRDVEVEGVPIPGGATIQVNLGSANRDETRYRDPDRFDIFREPRMHMAFAFGPHRCLGMHLARMETRVVVNAVLERLPDVRLDPDAKDVHVTGLTFRAPQALPVLFG
jgi:cytochrome P450